MSTRDRLLRVTSPALLGALLLVACGAPLQHDAASRRHGVWVTLVSGPAAASLTPESLSAAMSGHFANMDRLIAEGRLWVAGPLGPPYADPAHRGVFVLDTPDTASGLALAASDPAVVAGVFALRAQRFATDAPFETIVALDAAHQAARETARPGESVPWEGRAYVLARHPRTPDCDALVDTLRSRRGALFAGTLDEDEWLVCLDTDTPAAARALLVAAGAGKTAGDWTLMPWYASAALVDLPAGQR